MALLKLKNLSDNTIVEVISFNIDKDSNVLIIEYGKINIISLSIFKDMTLGTLGNSTQSASPATHELFKD